MFVIFISFGNCFYLITISQNKVPILPRSASDPLPPRGQAGGHGGGAGGLEQEEPGEVDQEVVGRHISYTNIETKIS